MAVLRVMDTSFTPLAYIDNASSIQWTRKLWEVGTFEIHIDLNHRDANKLTPESIVFLDRRRAGIVDYYEVQENNNGTEVIAKGKELKCLCLLRLTVPGQLEDTQYFGYDRFPGVNEPDKPAESVIKHYVDRHMVSPDNTDRVFPRLTLADDRMRGQGLRWQSRFEPLSTVFKDIGELTGIGYEIRLDLENECFVFDVIEGNDNTAGGGSPVIFAPAWGNVSGIKYSEDINQWLNTGYAGGAGENEGRLIHTVYENDVTRTGFERRETWLDCGSVEMINDLLYEGKYKLKDKARIRGLTGDVVTAGPFTYQKDWELGDYVTIQSQKSGVELDVQITEVKEVYEKGKTDIKPTFGKRNKNALDEIRKIGVVR